MTSKRESRRSWIKESPTSAGEALIEPNQRRWSSVSRYILTGVSLEIAIIGFLFLLVGFSLWSSLVLAIVLIILFRIWLALMSFAIAWSFRSQQTGPSLTIGEWLNLVLREIAAFLKLFFIYHAWEPLLNKHDELPPSDVGSDIPILFVHGFLSNAGFWVVFKRYFRNRGFRSLFTINLDPMINDIDDYAEQLARRVAQVHALVGQRKLILVGQSMGGLVCRAYIAKYGDKYVRKVITMGSPHQGTLTAYLLWGRNLSQMRPNSEWLARLNAKKVAVPITTHNSVHDNIVVPQDSARLAGAKEYAMRGLGHLSMAFSTQMMDSVVKDIGTNNQKT
ncbi:MAG: alpha/beta fold hydrolase [Arenicellales bacterium]|nr:alpha/beta fold hydrolase [Arenicellales bacterium]